MRRRTLYFLVVCAALSAQLPNPAPQGAANPDRLPDGRNRTELILKADHEASLRDAEQMRKLIDEVKMDMEKNDRHVLSLGTLKKLDEIEKLSKRIRTRMKRF
jgi:hypothetical protein